jgi:hypothetical protein
MYKWLTGQNQKYGYISEFCPLISFINNNGKAVQLGLTVQIWFWRLDYSTFIHPLWQYLYYDSKHTPRLNKIQRQSWC